MEFIWRKAEDRSGRAAFWRIDISGAQVDALVTEQWVERLVHVINWPGTSARISKDGCSRWAGIEEISE